MWYQWLIFGSIALLVPIEITILKVQTEKKHTLTKKQKDNNNLYACKLILFYWLCDLFYMSFIIDNLICRYIFGGLVMLIIFFNLSVTFLGSTGKKSTLLHSVGLLQDFVVGIGLSIYLIYIISNDDLRSVAATIAAAVYGGLLTLVGVAWTIKDGAAKKHAEDVQKNIPYLQLTNKTSDNILQYRIIYELNSECIYKTTLQPIRIKNISQSIIIIEDIKIENYETKFERKLLAQNDVCTLYNDLTFLREPISQITLIISEVLGNKYQVVIPLKTTKDDRTEIIEPNGNKRYNYDFVYEATEVSLPEIVERASN